MDEYLTSRQTQALLNVDRITIYRMINDGRLHGVKIGQQWRFPRHEVERLLTGQPHVSVEPSDVGLPTFPTHCAQTIQDLFSGVGQVGAVIIDPSGEPITVQSRHCALCKMVQSSAYGEAACQSSWKSIAAESMQGMTQAICHAGYYYAVAPIISQDNFFGTVLVGPFLSKTIDSKEKTRVLDEVSKKYLLSREKLEEAIRDVPVIDTTLNHQVETWPLLLARAIQSILNERSGFVQRLQQIANLTQIS